MRLRFCRLCAYNFTIVYPAGKTKSFSKNPFSSGYILWSLMLRYMLFSVKPRRVKVWGRRWCGSGNSTSSVGPNKNGCARKKA